MTEAPDGTASSIDARVRRAVDGVRVTARGATSVVARSIRLAERRRRRRVGVLVASSVMLVGSLAGARVLRHTGGDDGGRKVGTVGVREPNASAGSVLAPGLGAPDEENPSVVPVGWEDDHTTPSFGAISAGGADLVLVVSGAPGPRSGLRLDPCERGYRAEISETPKRVVITIRGYRAPGSGQASCTLAAFTRHVHVRLAAPLGDRTVVRGDGTAVPVIADRSFAARWLPAGWSLVSSGPGPDRWLQTYQPAGGDGRSPTVTVTVGGPALLDAYIGGIALDRPMISGRAAAFLRAPFESRPPDLVIAGGDTVIVLTGDDAGTLEQIAAGLSNLPPAPGDVIGPPQPPSGTIAELLAGGEEGPAIVTHAWVVVRDGEDQGVACDEIAGVEIVPPRCASAAATIEWYPPTLHPPAGGRAVGDYRVVEVDRLFVQRKAGQLFVLPNGVEPGPPPGPDETRAPIPASGSPSGVDSTTAARTTIPSTVAG